MAAEQHVFHFHYTLTAGSNPELKNIDGLWNIVWNGEAQMPNNKKIPFLTLKICFMNDSDGNLSPMTDGISAMLKQLTEKSLPVLYVTGDNSYVLERAETFDFKSWLQKNDVVIISDVQLSSFVSEVVDQLAPVSRKVIHVSVMAVGQVKETQQVPIDKDGPGQSYLKPSDIDGVIAFDLVAYPKLIQDVMLMVLSSIPDVAVSVLLLNGYPELMKPIVKGILGPNARDSEPFHYARRLPIVSCGYQGLSMTLKKLHEIQNSTKEGEAFGLDQGDGQWEAFASTRKPQLSDVSVTNQQNSRVDEYIDGPMYDAYRDVIDKAIVVQLFRAKLDLASSFLLIPGSGQLQGCLDRSLLMGHPACPMNQMVITKDHLWNLYRYHSDFDFGRDDKWKTLSAKDGLKLVGDKVDRFLKDKLHYLYDDTTFYNYFEHLCIWACFKNDKSGREMAKIAWQNSQSPIATALILSAILGRRAEHEKHCGKIKEYDVINDESQYFLHQAMQTMDAVYLEEVTRMGVEFEHEPKSKLANGDVDTASQMMDHILTQPIGTWNGATIEDLLQSLPPESQGKFKNCEGCKTVTRWRWIYEKSTLMQCVHYSVPFLHILLLLVCFGLAFCNVTWSTTTWLLIALTGSTLIFPCFGLFVRCIKRFRKKRHLRIYLSEPFMIFSFHWISYLCFLVIFSWFTMVELKPINRPSDIGILECVIWVYTISQYLDEIRQISEVRAYSIRKKLSGYFDNNWNRVDVAAIMMQFLSILLRCTIPNSTFFYARFTYIITLVLYFLRLLHGMYAFEKIGPKIQMIWLMMSDLVFFTVILINFMVSYAVILHSIRTPNTVPGFKFFIIPYFHVFGELFMDEFKVDVSASMPWPKLRNETTNVTVLNMPLEYYNDTYHINTTSGDGQLPSRSIVVPEEKYDIICTIIMGFYLMASNVLLLNMLIAMFSKTFDRIQEDEDNVRSLQLFDLVSEYQKKSIFPPPFIVLSLAWTFIKFVKGKIFRKEDTRLDYHLTRYISMSALHKPLETWEDLLVVAELRGFRKYIEELNSYKQQHSDVNEIYDGLRSLSKRTAFDIDLAQCLKETEIIRHVKENYIKIDKLTKVVDEIQKQIQKNQDDMLDKLKEMLKK